MWVIVGHTGPPGGPWGGTGLIEKPEKMMRPVPLAALMLILGMAEAEASGRGTFKSPADAMRFIVCLIVALGFWWWGKSTKPPDKDCGER
jgi:hypothetical protein